MANGQFIIPGTLENDELRHTVDEAFEEIALHKPELEQALYSDVLDIQVDLEEMRAFATEANLPRSFGQRVTALFSSAPRPLQERLVDAESKIGGEIFGNE